MKNQIKSVLFLFVMIFFLQSCLDRDPISEIGESSFYKDQEDIYQAVIACYNGLQAPMNNEWYLTELRSDNSRLYDSKSTSTGSKNISLMDMFRVETSHPENTAYWDNTYHNIANCNTVLGHLDVVEDETLKTVFEGEAKFLRGYHYFNLVRLYGPVFLVTERITGAEAKTKERSTIEDVYALIISDLKFAAEKLPVAFGDSNKGLVDRWAAKTLLAKVYLTIGNLPEAKQLLLEVENSSIISGYGLLTDYSSVFSIENEMNKEILFAVRYKAGNIGLGSSFANDFAPASSFALIANGGGSGSNCPTQDLVNAFAPNDKRKPVCLAETWLDEAYKPVFVPYVTKYLSPVAVKNDAENDWIVLRYADVVLMLAEIENELSGPAAGLPRLNQIRTRAGLEELQLSDVSDKNKFRTALFNERRFEFAFENQRFFDLVRSNQLIPVMKQHFDTEMEPFRSTGELTPFYKDPAKSTYLPNTTLAEWQILLPIPLNVMSVSPNVTQNPGY
jgi:hypothetical protein